MDTVRPSPSGNAIPVSLDLVKQQSVKHFTKRSVADKTYTGQLYFPGQCKIQHGKGKFVFMGKIKFDKAELRCAPTYDEFVDLQRTSKLKGTTLCTWDAVDVVGDTTYSRCQFAQQISRNWNVHIVLKKSWNRARGLAKQKSTNIADKHIQTSWRLRPPECADFVYQTDLPLRTWPKTIAIWPVARKQTVCHFRLDVEWSHTPTTVARPRFRYSQISRASLPRRGLRVHIF